MAKIIGIVNEKGGVGKSTICFNLAWELMKKGRRVLMIDLDGQRANLTFIAGMDKNPDTATMYDVLVKGKGIRQAVLVVEDTLHIVPAAHAVTMIHQDNSPIDRMKKAMDTLQSYYDYVLIDVPPTPGRAHALTLTVADFVLVAMLPDIASLEANVGITETVKAAQGGVNPKLKVLGLVFNRWAWRPLRNREAVAAGEKMAASLGTKVFDTKIRGAGNVGDAFGVHEGVTTYDPKSNAAEDFRALANEFEMEVEKYGK